MADVTDPGSPKTTKRRLRTPTETVRERNKRIETKNEAKSLKDAAPSKPNVLSSFWFGFSWPVRQLGAVLAKFGRFLGKYKVFRFLGRILFPRYFRNSWRELRLVTWPSRSKSLQLTWAVIVFSIIFGVIVAIVDFGLDKLFKEFIIK